MTAQSIAVVVVSQYGSTGLSGVAVSSCRFVGCRSVVVSVYRTPVLSGDALSVSTVHLSIRTACSRLQQYAVYVIKHDFLRTCALIAQNVRNINYYFFKVSSCALIYQLCAVVSSKQ